MILQRRLSIPTKKIKDTIVAFTKAGTTTWTVPAGITEVDVFLVGGGGGGSHSGGGGGYTKAFRGSRYLAPTDGTTWEALEDGGHDGNAIPVVPGESIRVIVGAGGTGVAAGNAKAADGGFSQFKNANYKVGGGVGGNGYYGSNGGSGGSSDGSGLTDALNDYAGSDGGNAITFSASIKITGIGQGHTTRDFGELTGKRNAGGGAGQRTSLKGGESDYTENSGAKGGGTASGYGGGGHGGGGGGRNEPAYAGGTGGSGKILIRY